MLFGAELPDRRRGDVDVRADPGGGATRADARELLDKDGLVQVVAALTAQLGGILQTDRPLCGELWENLVGKPALGLPLLRMRCEFAVQEAANGLAQLFVLVRP